MEVVRTTAFSNWLKKLRDRQARAIIVRRIERLQVGNPGDVEPVGAGVSEMRIHHGPGYRVYYVQRGGATIFLLWGGAKKTQAADIQTAIEMSRLL